MFGNRELTKEQKYMLETDNTDFLAYYINISLGTGDYFRQRIISRNKNLSTDLQVILAKDGINIDLCLNPNLKEEAIRELLKKSAKNGAIVFSLIKNENFKNLSHEIKNLIYYVKSLVNAKRRLRVKEFYESLIKEN